LKRIALGWRLALWFLAIGWTPVAAEVFLDYLFGIEARFKPAILIIPYIWFITGPLSCLAMTIVLFKGAKAARGLLRHIHQKDAR
jgi:hypothetical protein